MHCRKNMRNSQSIWVTRSTTRCSKHVTACIKHCCSFDITEAKTVHSSEIREDNTKNRSILSAFKKDTKKKKNNISAQLKRTLQYWEAPNRTPEDYWFEFHSHRTRYTSMKQFYRASSKNEADVYNKPEKKRRRNEETKKKEKKSSRISRSNQNKWSDFFEQIIHSFRILTKKYDKHFRHMNTLPYVLHSKLSGPVQDGSLHQVQQLQGRFLFQISSFAHDQLWIDTQQRWNIIQKYLLITYLCTESVHMSRTLRSTTCVNSYVTTSVNQFRQSNTSANIQSTHS